MRRPGPLRRRTRLRPRSRKRRKLDRERAALVEAIRSGRTDCEWWSFTGERCFRRPSDVHEKLTRARGGSVLDEGNVVLLCRFHHDFVHDHLEWAGHVGLLRSQYARNEGTT